MGTALDLIKGALLNINSYQSGEVIADSDSNDCLYILNDLLDSWSIQKWHVYGVQQYDLQWVPGKNTYTVGNPTNADIGEPPIIGTFVAGSITVAISNPAPDLIVGATLFSAAGALLPGTTVVSITPPVWTADTAAFTVDTKNTAITADAGYIVTMSQAAIANATLDTVTYSIPGDFPIPRPNRLTSGYTTISGLDFTLDIAETEEQYNAILYKPQPGPWPVVAWYNPQYPYGILKVYQTPGMAAPFTLFTTTILQRLTLNQTFILPPGYARALKWCLAEELWPQYHGGRPCPPKLEKQASISLKALMQQNAIPARVSTYDPILVRPDRGDYGFILSGGYR